MTREGIKLMVADFGMFFGRLEVCSRPWTLLGWCRTC